MTSWLELLFNIIGYGGFVVIASRHHETDALHGAADAHSDPAELRTDRV